MKFTYPGQRPETPFLFHHSLLILLTFPNSVRPLWTSPDSSLHASALWIQKQKSRNSPGISFLTANPPFTDPVTVLKSPIPGCYRLFKRGFRFRPSLKKRPAVSPLVSSAFGRTRVGLRPTKRSSPSRARKTSGTQGRRVGNRARNYIVCMRI